MSCGTVLLCAVYCCLLAEVCRLIAMVGLCSAHRVSRPPGKVLEFFVNKNVGILCELV